MEAVLAYVLRTKWRPGYVVVQLRSLVRLFATPWTAASQASLFFTISQSLLKLMYIELVMPSNHLILCGPLLLLPLIFPNIRGFSSGSVHPKVLARVLELQLQHQSFQWIFRVDVLQEWLAWSPRGKRDCQESITTVRRHQFFGTQPFYGSALISIYDYWKNHSFD